MTQVQLPLPGFEDLVDDDPQSFLTVVRFIHLLLSQELATVFEGESQITRYMSKMTETACPMSLYRKQHEICMVIDRAAHLIDDQDAMLEEFIHAE